MLEQEGGCTLEELLAEDEFTLQQCKASNPKLTEFLCQRTNLEELIRYATLTPKDESHDVAHKYPFVAADILCASKTIVQAMTEGGWSTNNPEEDDDSDLNENNMVRDILTACNVSPGLYPENLFNCSEFQLKEKLEKKETLVEELDLNEYGNDSSNKKKNNEPETEDTGPVPKNDWSLLDKLFTQFIATDRDQMLSVLCGYFNKVVQSLLVKESAKTLEYLLIRKEGQIFDGLLKHITHHSLATLMIELLQTQVKPDDTRNKRITMYNSDGSDNYEDTKEQEEAKLTPLQV